MLLPTRHFPSRAPRTWELNLADWPRGHHTRVVFERLDDLGPDDHLLIACDYEPETLRGQIEGWCPDEYRWSWTATGPVVSRGNHAPALRVQLRRLGAGGSHSQAPGAASASALPTTTLTARPAMIAR
jgi:uncharacterized protein (DUF2249 family)